VIYVENAKLRIYDLSDSLYFSFINISISNHRLKNLLSDVLLLNHLTSIKYITSLNYESNSFKKLLKLTMTQIIFLNTTNWRNYNTHNFFPRKNFKTQYLLVNSTVKVRGNYIIVFKYFFSYSSYYIFIWATHDFPTILFNMFA